MTNTIKTFPLTGVAIGPGDPELISLKALKHLQQADVVYFVTSKIEDNLIQSFSKQIIDAYNLKVLCKPLLFPMLGKNRDQFYQNAYQTLKADVKIGLRVCMVSEGDLGFYSTFGYILKLAKADSLPVICIPGIPAFIAGAAQATTPIVDGNYSFINLALPESFNEIETELATNKAVVVMKMKVLSGWFNFLKNIKREFVYIEKTGTTDEFTTSNYMDLENRKIPYFALILFPKTESLTAS